MLSMDSALEILVTSYEIELLKVTDIQMCCNNLSRIIHPEEHSQTPELGSFGYCLKLSVKTCIVLSYLCRHGHS